jgi:hypothetical protein
MNDAKYIGMDVHQATISAAVRDSSGNLVMEAIVEMKAETILQFIRGLHGSLYVTFEEGTWAAWLHDLLQPHVRGRACAGPFGPGFFVFPRATLMRVFMARREPLV